MEKMISKAELDNDIKDLSIRVRDLESQITDIYTQFYRDLSEFGDPTVNGKIDAIADLLGIKFDVREQSTKVVAKPIKKKIVKKA